LIERVTFHNEENGFCVLRVKVRGHRDEVTVLGSLPSVSAGEWLEARARRKTLKVGRNELCPCGSGKKYKRCCGGATIN
jgi:uncharacterized protein YchJ